MVAVIVAIPLRILLSNREWWFSVVDHPIGSLFIQAGLTLLSLNILLFIFNLVPIPPLDGWSVLKGIVPREMANRMDDLTAQYANMIPLVFMGFILVLFLSGGALLGPLIFGIRDLLLGI